MNESVQGHAARQSLSLFSKIKHPSINDEKHPAPIKICKVIKQSRKKKHPKVLIILNKNISISETSNATLRTCRPYRPIVRPSRRKKPQIENILINRIIMHLYLLNRDPTIIHVYKCSDTTQGGQRRARLTITTTTQEKQQRK